MTPREFRKEKGLESEYFQELTKTGIKPNYVNIERFAYEYHQAKLKLLGIEDVVEESEQLVCGSCGIKLDDMDKQLGLCFECGYELAIAK